MNASQPRSCRPTSLRISGSARAIPGRTALFNAIGPVSPSSPTRTTTSTSRAVGRLLTQTRTVYGELLQTLRAMGMARPTSAAPVLDEQTVIVYDYFLSLETDTPVTPTPEARLALQMAAEAAASLLATFESTVSVDDPDPILALQHRGILAQARRAAATAAELGAALTSEMASAA